MSAGSSRCGELHQRNALFRVSLQTAAAESRAWGSVRRGETDGRVERGRWVGGGGGVGERERNSFSLPRGRGGTIPPAVVTESFIYLRGPSVQSLSVLPQKGLLDYQRRHFNTGCNIAEWAANGGGSLSGVQSPSSSYLEWVHPEYTCRNGDISTGGESELSK